MKTKNNVYENLKNKNIKMEFCDMESKISENSVLLQVRCFLNRIYRCFSV